MYLLRHPLSESAGLTLWSLGSFVQRGKGLPAGCPNIAQANNHDDNNNNNNTYIYNIHLSLYIYIYIYICIYIYIYIYHKP